MKVRITLALTLAGAFGLGALTSQAINAQSKPPAYQILEVEVNNRDAYMKEFAPMVAKLIQDGGGKFLVRGGMAYAADGAPPKGRIVVTAFDNVDQAKAFLATPAYAEARKVGDKYATFHSYIVEGVAK